MTTNTVHISIYENEIIANSKLLHSQSKAQTQYTLQQVDDKIDKPTPVSYGATKYNKHYITFCISAASETCWHNISYVTLISTETAY